MPRKMGSTNMHLKYELFRNCGGDWQSKGLFRTYVDIGKVTGYSAPYISMVLKGHPLNFRREWKVETISPQPVTFG